MFKTLFNVFSDKGINICSDFVNKLLFGSLKIFAADILILLIFKTVWCNM